ncbi:bifunctional phosphopantothenoylcysteine decarboxylase/phosphopantothenate--cysteine ligase CoaBC [Saliphagus sp. LR7]|uniref:bifunctional phosphopantothenoylcysteine decarboxylase/phosphopantothenate--cysteine ligase CoaBC n=1 Tax=Saliphagus sp. LR7 TaxID=2282654 RepID=UPI000DF76820|nr:bifunctional phosphopantothenoylcysteine decarboxylase/phosphopantothenate--cysteine ligase CoaBC [Saliphagus sp. LR7]
MLEGVNVAVGVTGSIAAVKTVELVHELRRQGASVRAVTTDSARGIVHPWAIGFATGEPVVTEITGQVEHVSLCGREGWADVFLIAPATANTVGKVAAAVDDTPVTTCATTAIGAGVPVVVAPAMHEPMYDHPGVLSSIERVEEWGVSFVSPRIEEGKAKIAGEEAICTAVARAAGDRPLEGTRVVVTAGATGEAIDPIRVLTNRSSGRTGREVARACHVHGAEVVLVHGPVGPRPFGRDDGSGEAPYADVRRVESAEEMTETTVDACEGATALVSAAAIGDYTVDTRPEKIRSGGELVLELEPTPKLVDTVREEYPELPIVGFKAETEGGDEAMVAAARELGERVGLAFVVANDAGVMGETETRAILVDGQETTTVTGSKGELAAAVADALAGELD